MHRFAPSGIISAVGMLSKISAALSAMTSRGAHAEGLELYEYAAEQLSSQLKPGDLATWQSTSPIYPRYTSRGMINAGFHGSPAFRTCVEIYCDAIVQARLQVEDRDGVPLKTHPLLDLLWMGGRQIRQPGLTRAPLWEALVQDRLNYGNAYWWKVRNGRGQMVEIRRLDPSMVRLQLDDDLNVALYRYEVNGELRWINTSDVMHWRCPNPSPDLEAHYFGAPEIRAARKDLAVGNDLTDHFQVSVANHMTPAMIFEREGKTPWDATSAREFLDVWKKTHGGRNRGKNQLALTSGGTIKVVGQTMKDMDIGNLESIPARKIYEVHRIHPLLGGHGGGGSLSNGGELREAREAFWTGPMSRTLTEIAEQVDLFLLSEFRGGDQLTATFDLSRVEVLADRKLDRMVKAGETWQTGLYSRHALQRAAGDKPSGLDVFFDDTRDANQGF